MVFHSNWPFSLTRSHRAQYMIILFMLFLIQFSIACSCLAVNAGQQQQFAEEGWNRVPESIKEEVQDTFICCGFNQTTVSDTHPTCEKVTVNIPYWFVYTRRIIHFISSQHLCCPENSPSECACPPCMQKLEDTIDYAFKLCGGIGLFFSFTEVSGFNFSFCFT